MNDIYDCVKNFIRTTGLNPLAINEYDNYFSIGLFNSGTGSPLVNGCAFYNTKDNKICSFLNMTNRSMLVPEKERLENPLEKYYTKSEVIKRYEGKELQRIVRKVKEELS